MYRVVVLILVVYAIPLDGMAQGMYDVTLPGDIVVGVPDDGDWPGAEHPALAIDDNVNTKYLHFKGDFNPNVGPTGLRITPSIGPTIVTGLTFSTANDFPGRDPVSFELYGSNNTINGPYTLIASGDILDFRGVSAWPRLTKNETPITFPNPVEYEHYQLLFTAIRGPVGGAVNSMQIAEVELLGRRRITLKATRPQPSDGSICTNTWVNLSWIPGDCALSHKVYFSADSHAVTQRDASALIAVTDAPSTPVGLPESGFPDALCVGTTYYWCVDEVNDVETDSPWYGDVWSFRVPDEPAVYLLITNERLAPAFEPLVQRRTEQGFDGRLLTVETICASYIGEDEPEQIRNCIVDHYARYDTQYVALGGDQAVVPVRWCDPKCTGAPLPADLYYADMDGSDWDLNQNGIYGEVGEVTEIELTPEVHLGRIPLRTSEDAVAYINKVVAYEQSSPDGFANSMLLTGHWGFASGNGRRNDLRDHDPVDGAERWQLSYIYYHFIQHFWQAVPLHFLWDGYSSWDTEVCGDYGLTPDHLREKLNNGYHFVFFWGHGNASGWSLGGSGFNIHASALTNAIPNIVMAWSCGTAFFDNEGTCLSERFIQNPHGGAVAYLGFSRSSKSYLHFSTFYKSLFKERPISIGEAMTLSKAALATNCVDNPYRQYAFVLHGDPCIQLLWEEHVKHLQLFKPKGCEVIERGTDLYIRWNAAGTGFEAHEKVKLEYSSNSARTWDPIPGAQSLRYNGRSFRWSNCPLPGGSQYRVRVVSLSDPSVNDMSGRDFTIGDVVLLTVRSTPVEGVSIDLSGSKTAHFYKPTDFNITILKGASVNVSAPATAGESSEFEFVRWMDESGNTVASTTDYSFIITRDKTIAAEYAKP